MLNIFVSRYNNQIEEKIFKEAITAYQQGERVYLLVPEQFTLQNEINLMEHIQEKAVSRIKIMSFQRLALEALSKLGGIKRQHIDNLGKTMALKNILYANQKRLRSAASIHKEGYIEALLRQIAELKRSLITPDMLRDMAEKLGNAQLLRQKLEELAFIYEEFDSALGGRYVDNEDRLGQLAELGDLQYLENTKIFIYSFLDFTGVEQNIIGNLLASGVDVTLGLCYDEDTMKTMEESVFYTTQKTVDQLKDKAKELGVRVQINALADKDLEILPYSPDIRQLGDNMFRLIPKVQEQSVSDIRLYGAHSIDEEVHQIAGEISRLVVEENYRYKDFMVISGSLESYNSIVKQVFGQYQIPYFIDEKRPIINSPIIKTIVSALNILERGFVFQEMMVFLKNGFVNPAQNEIYLFENYMMKRKFKGNMFLEDKYFQQLLGDVDNQDNVAKASKNTDFHSIQGVRRYLLDLFTKPMEKIKEDQTPKAYEQILLDIFEAMDMEPKIQSFLNQLRQKNLLDDANANNQVWNVFLRILEQASEIFGDQTMNFGLYKSLVLEAIKSHKLAVIPPAMDQVIVGNMDRSRSDTKKIIFICGANSGSIPKAYKESGLLTQEDKIMVSDLGLELPSLRTKVDYNEQLMIYIMMTRATQKLYLSYSTEDGSLPSPLLGQIKEVFPAIQTETQRSIAEKDKIRIPRPTIDKMAAQLKKYVKGENVDPIWLEALSYYRQNSATASFAESALDGIYHSNHRANIKDTQRIYKRPLKISTTRIKSYDSCPFKHFVQYGLKAKERKEFSIEPAEMGLVVHSTVEELVNHLQQNAAQILTMDKSETDALVDQYFDHSAKEILAQYDIEESRNQFMLQRLKKTAKRVSRTAVEHLKNGKFQLLAQEEPFDEGKNIPPIIIKVGDEEIILTGTVDRIDVLQDGEKSYIKVIDYKTSKKSFSLSDAYNGLDIQLVVYMSAVLSSDKLIKTQKYPGGMFYFSIFEPLEETTLRSKEQIEKLLMEQFKMDGILLDDDQVIKAMDEDNAQALQTYIRKGRAKGGKKSDHLFTQGEFDALMDHVHKNIQKSVEGIRQGNIQVNPAQAGNWTACGYCRYKGICRFEPNLGEKYNKIKKYDNKEVRELLAQEYGLLPEKTEEAETETTEPKAKKSKSAKVAKEGENE